MFISYKSFIFIEMPSILAIDTIKALTGVSPTPYTPTAKYWSSQVKTQEQQQARFAYKKIHCHDISLRTAE